jgi:hypothetical protein
MRLVLTNDGHKMREGRAAWKSMGWCAPGQYASRNLKKKKFECFLCKGNEEVFERLESS